MIPRLQNSNIIAFMRDPTFSKIDISGSHLVLVMKLHSFACSVYDGQRPLEELDETQKASRIPEVPGLLPFLGYA
jgi:lysophospholipid acyltransferase